MGGPVKPVLLAEASLTRRRALSALLARRGCAVTALASLDEAYTVLKRLSSQPTSFTAVVLGWPEYADGVAEDVFGLLHGDHYEHLPVLVLADAGKRRRGQLAHDAPAHRAAAVDRLPRGRRRARTSCCARHPRPPRRLESAAARCACCWSTIRPPCAWPSRACCARYGYEVDTADSVAEGLEKARRGRLRHRDRRLLHARAPTAPQLIAALQARPAAPRTCFPPRITGTYSDSRDHRVAGRGRGRVPVQERGQGTVPRAPERRSRARSATARRSTTSAAACRASWPRSATASTASMPRAASSSSTRRRSTSSAMARAEDLVGRNAFETFHYAFEDGTHDAAPARRSSASATPTAARSRPGRPCSGPRARRAVPVECTVYPDADRRRARGLGGRVPRRLGAAHARGGTALAGRARRADQAPQPRLVRAPARAGDLAPQARRARPRCCCSSTSTASSTSTTPPATPPATSCCWRSASA